MLYPNLSRITPVPSSVSTVTLESNPPEPIDIVPSYRFHITSNSWPVTKQIKCIKCARLTEGTWGKFGYCLDCHLKKACSSCGADAQGKSENDDMPKCSFHLKLEQQK